ncbi:MAG: hypothetical protein K9J21_11940 [Bacteroidales bacterium]|nr:hypothetical protein [Bacteroidales bacterium]
MNIKIKIFLPYNPDEIYAHFTGDLFLALAPPLSGIKLIRFDGSKPGSIVELQMGPALFNIKWISEITDEYVSEEKIWFQDQGKVLPFFLTYWKHNHIIEGSNQKSYIIEDINYKTGTLLTDVLLYPLLYLQFAYRKYAYPKYFSKIKANPR